MRRLTRRRRRLDRQSLTRSWRRSGGPWGGGWSLCCRDHGSCRRLPPFRKVRGRMGHPTLRVLSPQFLVLMDPTLHLLFFLPLLLVLTGDGRGRPSLHRERFWM